jgi:hypothetical protein
VARKGLKNWFFNHHVCNDELVLGAAPRVDGSQLRGARNKVRSSTLPTYNNKFLTFIFMNQIKETSIDDLLDGAKMAILNSLPFFGGVIISLRSGQEMRGLDTLATDGETIFFDPIAVARFCRWRMPLAGVIIHEVGHCVSGAL